MSGGLTGREMQVIGADGLYKAIIDSLGNVYTIDETIKTNLSAKAAKSSLMAGTDGTNQVPIKTDAVGKVYVVSELISELPSFRSFLRRAIAAGAVFYQTVSMTEKTAIKEFHIGGRVACEGVLAKYAAANFELLGGFNSSAQVSAWVNTSAGSSALLAWAYATDQFIEGTGSAKLTFTQSDNNNYPEISFNFSTPRDLSSWRYVKAAARVTVAAGGGQSRRVQIRITSGTAVRIWEIVGTTTTPPFSTEQWHYIVGELENPTSTAGTGTFDINQVNQISLRLLDGGNKSGSIWWDNVLLEGELTILDKIYSASGDTRQLVFDPVLVLESTDTLLMSVKNNGAVSGELQASASGVNV